MSGSSDHQRLAALQDFYSHYPSTLGRVHLMTCAAVSLGGFCRVSASFENIGRMLMPVTARGKPRGKAWRRYARACGNNSSAARRAALWSQANLRDMRAVRRSKAMESFQREQPAAEVPRPCLEAHLAITLGCRSEDQAAFRGRLSAESVIARAALRGLQRLLLHGWPLLLYLLLVALRALWTGGSRRRAVIVLVRALPGCLGLFAFLWRGLRAPALSRAVGARWRWNLLASVLGARLSAVHPEVRRFYGRPADFGCRVKVQFAKPALQALAWLISGWTGQGLAESGAGWMPARFLQRARSDGSLHFIRQIEAPGRRRVFDSDFTLRWQDSRAVLAEVFRQLGVEIRMELRVLADGGLAICGRQLRCWGVVVPMGGLRVEFQTRPAGPGRLSVIGRLEAVGGLAAALTRLLGWPALWGSIHYRVWAHCHYARPRALWFSSGRDDAQPPTGQGLLRPFRSAPGRPGLLRRPRRRQAARTLPSG